MKGRVLLATGIYPPETGGPATFVPALASEWTKRGFEVTVITYGDERTVRSPNWHVEVVSRTGGVLARYWRYFLRVKHLAKAADIVFLQGAFSEGFPGALAAKCVGVPTMLRVPGDFAWEGFQRERPTVALPLEQFLEQPKPWKWRLVFALESWVARSARCIVMPSRYLQTLARAWGVSETRQRVIYNTVEIAQLPPRTELRQRLKIPEDRVVLLTNVRGVPWKRVDFLLRVLAELPSQYHFVHIGEGPELSRWKDQVHDLKLEDRVTFCGRVPYSEVQIWSRAADAFVLPSLYEGFPHVALEAACQGTPCFVSDKGGNPEAHDAYPERIQVLPYDDFDAWLQALSHLPPHQEPLTPTPFAAVADAYADALDSCL